MTRQSILVVDDNPLMHRLISLALESEGYSIIQVLDGHSALERAAERAPDLVLQDLMLPDIDGFDLARRLKATPGLANVPILALSGLISRLDAAKAEGVGFAAMFQKPIEIAQLVAAVREHIGPPSAGEGVRAPARRGASTDTRRARSGGMGGPLGRRPPSGLRGAPELEAEIEALREENARLARLAAVQTNQLAVLGELADALSRTDASGAPLGDALAACVDACGAERSALYLLGPQGRFALAGQVGYALEDRGALGACFGHASIFHRAMDRAGPLAVPSPELPAEIAEDLLCAARGTSALLLPLVSRRTPLGAILLVSSTRDLTHPEVVTFGAMSAFQIGQTVQLANAFAAAAASERRWRAVMENAHDAVFVYRLAGDVIDTNHCAEALLGCSRAGIIGRPFGELATAEGQAILKARRSIMEPTRIEDLALRRANGRPVWVDLSIAPVEVGGQRLLVTIARDVTERRRAEQRRVAQLGASRVLAETETLAEAGLAIVRVLCETLGWDLGALWTMGEHDGLLRFSGSWQVSSIYAADLLEQSRARALEEGMDLAGRAWALRAPVWVDDVGADPTFTRRMATSRAGLRTGIAVAIVSQGAVVGAVELFRRDAGPREPELVSFLEELVDKIGHFVARRRAERELRQSEERLAQAHRIAGLGSWEYDLVRSETVCTLEMLHLLGRRPSELDSGPEGFLACVHPADQELVQRELQEVASGRRRVRFDHRIVRPDGAIRTLHQEGEVLVDARQRPLRLVCTARDVTEQRAIEEHLRKEQKLDAIGGLAAGVAHDFDDILAAIRAGSEAALRGLDPDHPLRAEIEAIERAAARGAALTDQLLSFGRRQVFEPRRLDLGVVIGDMETILRRLLGEEVQLVCALDPGLRPILADPGQIARVLLNLAVNAREAMPAGGAFRVGVRNLIVGDAETSRRLSLPPGAYVELRASDDGHGMDAATKAHIFEPFFTTKEPGRGTGLGLAMVYGVVRQAGGQIRVDSAPGAGATFTILLPCAPPAPITAR